jgi:hypothetical protein
MSVTTLNQIVQNLSEIASKHQQLHAFKVGNPDEFYTSGTATCAEMWLLVSDASLTRNTATFKFTMWLLDGVRRGEINQLEVQSDMVQVAQDINAQLEHPDYDWFYDQKPTLNIITEKSPYKWSGVFFDFTIKLKYPSDTCRIPFSSAPRIYPTLS